MKGASGTACFDLEDDDRGPLSSASFRMEGPAWNQSFSRWMAGTEGAGVEGVHLASASR